MKMRLLSLAAAFAVLTACAFGGEWPERKAIQMIIPFNAGGDSDFNGRTYARFLEKELGQKVVAVNIAGAGGAIRFSTSRLIVSMSGILRSKHWRQSTLNSHSAMFSQLPCLGV